MLQSSRGGYPVVNKNNWYLFQPMIGDGTFGELSWVELHRSKSNELIVTLVRELNDEECIRFADGHVHYFTWSLLHTSPAKNGPSGAFTYAKKYSEGITGQRSLYPGEMSRSILQHNTDSSNKPKGGGALV